MLVSGTIEIAVSSRLLFKVALNMTNIAMCYAY